MLDYKEKETIQNIDKEQGKKNKALILDDDDEITIPLSECKIYQEGLKALTPEDREFALKMLPEE